MRLIFVFLVALLWCESPLHAAAPVERVKILLEYKQAKQLFANPYADLVAAIERRSTYTQIAEQRKARILQIGKKIYQQDNLYEVLVAAYATFADAAAVEAEIKMFRSLVGQLYAKVLTGIYQPGFDAEVERYWDNRDFKAMKANRKNTIGSYLKQSKQADPTGMIMAGMDIGVDLSLNAFKRRRYRKSLKQIKADTKLRKNNYVMDGSTETLKEMTYAFRQMKSVQIDWLTRFYYGRFGESATRTYLNAIEVTLDRAGETLMHNLNPDTKNPITPPAALAKPKNPKKPNNLVPAKQSLKP